MGGTIARTKKLKNNDTKSKGPQATPSAIGPNGVIQRCPAHVIKKTIRKKNHNPLNGLFEINEKIIVIIKVIIIAAGII
jgi:hypothetical protein